MKIKILTVMMCLFASITMEAQIINNLINGANTIINGSGQSLSNDEVVKGLKEALTVGSNNSSTNASKTDGFFKNTAIKIPFPPDAKKMESELRKIGMGKDCDKFILTINRAAEEAAKESAPIFVNAVKSMSITDGISILKGSDDAATAFLKSKTSADLKTKFKPVVSKAIQKVELTKYWNPLAKAYNRMPFVQKVNPDLEEYTTQKALDGLFKLLAQEELKIRKDPLARVSDILKKVFG